MSTTAFPTTAIFDFKSTTSTSTTTITYKPFTIDIPTTTTSFISTSNAPSTTTTDDDQIPSSNDSSFDWFGALVVFLIFFAAITFFVIRRKCTSPSGTYKIPKTNLVPRDYYVNFCKIDDEFIEIHAKALYGPSYVTSVENQNFEEHKDDDETCL
uniref:Uncharacterized protein n=1 Tax=Panagrolaimus davidi TaxID=227884 RepID=A0A914QXN6_9BILA